MTAELREHRRFLNGYYGKVRHVYDASRRYYLLGRDRALAQLLESKWETLVEIGPGTGRNLRLLYGKRPGARYAGVEASDEMLAHARARCPWATLQQGFAETFAIREQLGVAPDRILFSYSLSMILNQQQALLNARRALAPGGEVWVVDFADGAGMWRPLMAAFERFLAAFHVTPIRAELLGAHAASITPGPGSYYLIARIPAC